MGPGVLPARPVEVNTATSGVRAAAGCVVSHGAAGLQGRGARETGRG